MHKRTINNEQLVNDKYLYLFSDFYSDYCLNHDIEILLTQVRFFENFKSFFSGVKGMLANVFSTGSILVLMLLFKTH